jgi:hypothetical protein
MGRLPFGRREGVVGMTEKWSMKGKLLGACNCDWGCPCNFDARPTQGFCEGAYLVEVTEGRYGKLDLDGVRTVWAGHSPGPLHEGNVTSAWIIDEAATPEQREVMAMLSKGGGVGIPFDIFASVTSTWLGPVFSPIEIHWDGMRTKASVGGGSLFEIQASRIANPVTGDEEELYLDKPTGFTSLRSELGMSKAHVVKLEGLSYDHSGKYAEYAEFEWVGP